MQAYAEGFDILKNAAGERLPEEHRYALDLGEIAEVWRRGSVVGSWLLDLTAIALAESRSSPGTAAFVQDSGEGRWTVMAAIEEAVPAEVLSSALYARFRSRHDHTFGEEGPLRDAAQVRRAPGAPVGGLSGVPACRSSEAPGALPRAPRARGAAWRTSSS